MINRKLLLNKSYTWFNNQFFHSIWDTCIINNKKKIDKPELVSRIKSSILLAKKLNIIKLLKKNNTECAVIQHTVYQERFFFALLRKNKIDTIVQTKHVLLKQRKNEDYGFKHLDKRIFFDSYYHISKKKIDKYWLNFLKGKAKYLEAKIASKIRNKDKNYNKSKKTNVLMLHIFKDSPFTNIDRGRIFADYYIWVVETLKIISKSSENWVLRKHPSADRWGEDQKNIIKNILFKLFNNKIPKNIFFEDNLKSNIDQFKQTKRLITFSGNSHLEAACFGIKPIIISKTTLCNFDKNYYFKPTSKIDYENMILKGNCKKFTLNIKQQNICKRILYLIHNTINFGEDINSFHVFRNDDKKILNILFKKISNSLKKNYQNFFEIGFCIGSVYNQSLNKNYLRKFIKKNVKKD